jgi:hypothetical protein
MAGAKARRPACRKTIDRVQATDCAGQPTAFALDPPTRANDRVSKIALTILNAKAQGRGSRRLSDIVAQCDDAIPPTH